MSMAKAAVAKAGEPKSVGASGLLRKARGFAPELETEADFAATGEARIYGIDISRVPLYPPSRLGGWPRRGEEHEDTGREAEPSKAPSESALVRDRAVNPPSAGPALVTTRGALRAKLEVGRVDDPLEEEADQVADKVLRMPDPTAAAGAPEEPPGLPVTPARNGLSRKCATCLEDEEKGAMVQRRAAPGISGGASEAPPIVEQALRSGGRALDEETRRYFESRMRFDLSKVRIHTDARAAESARAVNALAYTVGQNIVFGQGRYAPGEREGKRLLAHELTHVVQQSGAPQSAQVGAAAGRRLMRKQPSEEGCPTDFVPSFHGTINAAAAKDHRGVPRAYYSRVPGTGTDAGEIVRGPDEKPLPLEAGKEVEAGQLYNHLWRAVCVTVPGVDKAQILWVLNEYVDAPKIAAADAPGKKPAPAAGAADKPPEKKPAETITGRKAKVSSPTTVSKEPKGDAANVLGDSNILVATTPLDVTGEAIAIAGDPQKRSWIPVTVGGDGDYKSKSGFVLSDTITIEAAPVQAAPKEDAEAKAKEDEAKRIAAEQDAAKATAATIVELIKGSNYAKAFAELDTQSMHQMLMVLDGLSKDDLINLLANLKSPASDGRYVKRLFAAIGVAAVGKGGIVDGPSILNALVSLKVGDDKEEQKGELVKHLEARVKDNDAAAKLLEQMTKPTSSSIPGIGIEIKASAGGKAQINTAIRYEVSGKDRDASPTWEFARNEDGAKFRRGGHMAGSGTRADDGSWTMTWTEVGEYRIECTVSGQKLVYFQEVVAAREAGGPLDTAFNQAETKDFESWRLAKGVTKVGIAQGDATPMSGTGKVPFIASDTANPTTPSRNLSKFTITPSPEAKKFSWYVTGAAIDRYSDSFTLDSKTFKKIKTATGETAMDLGSATTVEWMHLDDGVYHIWCEQQNAAGETINRVPFIQVVETGRDSSTRGKQVANYAAYLSSVDTAMANIEDDLVIQDKPGFTPKEGEGPTSNEGQTQRYQKKAVPVRAAYVPEKGGKGVPLTFYVGRDKAGGLALIDLQSFVTTRHYNANDIKNLFIEFKEKSSYPVGTIKFSVAGSTQYGIPAYEDVLDVKLLLADQVSEYAQKAALALGIGAAVAAVVPGLQPLALALEVLSATAGAAGGAASLISDLSKEHKSWTKIGIDITTIVTSLFFGIGAASKGVNLLRTGRAVTNFGKAGSFSYYAGLATAGTAGVLIADEGREHLVKILENKDGLSQSAVNDALAAEIFNLIVQETFIALMVKGMAEQGEAAGGKAKEEQSAGPKPREEGQTNERQAADKKGAEGERQALPESGENKPGQRPEQAARRGGATAQEAVEKGTLRTVDATPGHELKLTKEGCAICSFPCDWLNERYRREWDADPTWVRDWAPIQRDLEKAVASGIAKEEDAALALAQSFQARIEAAHVAYNTTLGTARTAFPAISAELSRLEASLVSQHVASNAEVINDIARMQADGKIAGFEAWVRDMAARAPNQVLDAIAEAQEARRLVAENAAVPGTEVEFIPRRSGHSTFDVHVKSAPGATGPVTRRVEVFNESKPIKTSLDFETGIAHGASKIDARSPLHGVQPESTVRVGWPPPDSARYIFDRDGSYYVPHGVDRGTPVAIGNLADDTLRRLNTPISQEVNQLAQVNIIDQNGNLVFSFKNDPVGGSNWTITFKRPLK